MRLIAASYKSFVFDEALNRAALRLGFPHACALLEARKAWCHAPVSSVERDGNEHELPIDPVLPANFDANPNDMRSPDEIAAWWDRPFAVSLRSGGFDVRCLHGGAWDRSSHLGIASSEAEALLLAKDKLASWLEARFTPTVHIGASDVRVFVDPPCPFAESALLGTFESVDQANEFIASIKR